MNRLPLPTLVSILLMVTLDAAPRLVVSTPHLAPESKMDLVFDLPVIDSGAVGTTTANDYFTVIPPLPGSLRWKTPNIAEFLPERAPTMSTEYIFTLGDGHSHKDGSAIPGGEFARIQSEEFRPRGWNSLGSRWSDSFSLATGSWIIYFNDAVDPSVLEPLVYFQSQNGLIVPATVEPITYQKMGYYGSRERTWAERSAKEAPTGNPAPENLVPHAITVSPKTPLPPAKEWRLFLKSGAPNQSSTARLTKNLFYQVGDIQPFQCVGIHANTGLDAPRSIILSFNDPLATTIPDNFFTDLLRISPKPATLNAKIEGKSIVVTGTLDEEEKYHVTISGPFVSAAGHPIEKSFSKEIEFHHLDPELTLPSHNEAQYAKGNRKYGFFTVNVSEAQLRVKALRGQGLIRTFQGYQNYTGNGHNGKGISPTAPLPWSMVDGEMVAEKTFDMSDQGIDTSKQIDFQWDEILGPEVKTGIYFVDVLGIPRPGVGGYQNKRKAQAIIQLTDIGLAWKITDRDAFIHAFSCETGKPLEGVTLRIYGDDAKLLHTAVTDTHGVATTPRHAEARHLKASLTDDAFVTAFDSTMSTVGLWHFPVRYSWLKPAEVSRQAFIFTDRPLYRPGETVRLKGIVRQLRGNAIEPAGSTPARLVILDPQEKEIRTENITISENGSFDFTHELAPETVGDHQFRLEFPEELAELENAENEYDDWERRENIRNNAMFTTNVQVQEFRRNAFEITQKLEPGEPGTTKVTGTIAAKYYQGTPVKNATAKQYANVSTSNPYPERFRDFLFGNHRSSDWGYWYHYFAYRWGDDEDRVQPFQHHSEFSLDEEGNASFEVPLPESKFPSRREISVSTEVTDSRLQTLTSVTRTVVDPASVYVGISRNDRLIRAGDEVPLRIVATDTEGNPYDKPLRLTATITREVNESVKVTGADGATTTRNQKREESDSSSQFTLDPSHSQAEGQTFLFKPTSNGLHFITLRGIDPQGREFSTVSNYYVYGTKEYPWLYEDGLRIQLVAEKKQYRPGETARVLVLSPIEGTALVTIEREKVLRSFQVELRSDNPVIEIPLGEGDAPNAYVSVLVIKGAADSSREHKEPQLRLGYCELMVENQRDRLAVSFDTPEPSYLPGSEITLGGNVLLADGSPAGGAEVTFFAEDEGTLAVTGYDTPDPMAYFYRPRQLVIESGTSFESFLAENTEFRDYFNKGFFVGGGGDLAFDEEMLRKNFDPCAAWAPAIRTGPDGSFQHTFRLPDTLTRYRVVAVAHHQITKFGHAESSILAKKDLMLEPKAPRFAHQGDRITTRLMVQNDSEYEGTWNISFNPHVATGQKICSSTNPPATTVSLAPGDSKTLEFAIQADAVGEAVLAWQAVPVSLTKGALDPALTRKLSDAVQSRFDVQYPMPRLRQTRLFQLGDAPTDILATFDKKLVQGDGSLTLEAAFSPLVEAAGSIDYLLSYPHGCVEQTSSSLIPWCAVDALRDFVPAFQSIPKRKVDGALQGGVDRLLSMQLANGSFSYWPGSDTAVDWATPYAGMVMLIAADCGASLPESAKESLCQALIASLRGMAATESQHELETHARALYCLALAGKPQSAYQNSLAERIGELNASARALLAAAIARANPDNRDAARRILESKTPLPTNESYWMPYSPSLALTLLAWTEIDASAEPCQKALDQLLRDRNPYGHWRTTWVNGWSLVALSSCARKHPVESESTTITLKTDLGSQTIQLNEQTRSASQSLPLAPDMTVTLSAHPLAFLRATLAARPAITPIQPTSANGMSIERFHQLVLPDGTMEPLKQPKPGDLILVTLRVTMPKDDTRYLVVEDPLPSLFETVSSDFASQTSALTIATTQENWQVSHSELRNDRAVFYMDHVGRSGTYTLSYLARCTLPGTVYVPPAKVESMYDPENVALSASREFTAQ